MLCTINGHFKPHSKIVDLLQFVKGDAYGSSCEQLLYEMELEQKRIHFKRMQMLRESELHIKSIGLYKTIHMDKSIFGEKGRKFLEMQKVHELICQNPYFLRASALDNLNAQSSNDWSNWLLISFFNQIISNVNTVLSIILRAFVKLF